MNDTLILHKLMQDMQIAYYWAFMFDAKGEANPYTSDTVAAQEATAIRACKNVALRAIKNKTIPKRMYVFANAFAIHADPLSIIDATYHLYEVDNAEEFEVVDESLGEPA